VELREEGVSIKWTKNGAELHSREIRRTPHVNKDLSNNIFPSDRAGNEEKPQDGSPYHRGGIRRRGLGMGITTRSMEDVEEAKPIENLEKLQIFFRRIR
jgi:hypothetical protein